MLPVRRGDPLAVEQPAHLSGHRTEALHRRVELLLVQPLGKLLGAGTQTEGEPPGTDFVEGRGQHGDACGAATPHVEHAGPEPDGAGAGRDLGQQHGGVVPPALGHEEAAGTRGVRRAQRGS